MANAPFRYASFKITLCSYPAPESRPINLRGFEPKLHPVRFVLKEKPNIFVRRCDELAAGLKVRFARHPKKGMSESRRRRSHPMRRFGRPTSSAFVEIAGQVHVVGLRTVDFVEAPQKPSEIVITLNMVFRISEPRPSDHLHFHLVARRKVRDVCAGSRKGCGSAAAGIQDEYVHLRSADRRTIIPREVMRVGYDGFGIVVGI